MIYFQVLDTPEPLRNIADLIAAQLEFHKKAFEILSELAPEVEALQIEQEVSRSIFLSLIITPIHLCIIIHQLVQDENSQLRSLSNFYVQNEYMLTMRLG